MKLRIHPDPITWMEVEAEPTVHPELAIHEINVRDLIRPKTAFESPVTGEVLGKVWAITHIGSGEYVIAGLLNKETALAAVSMIAEMKIELSNGWKQSYEIDAFQAAARMMTDIYFNLFSKGKLGCLTAA